MKVYNMDYNGLSKWLGPLFGQLGQAGPGVKCPCGETIYYHGRTDINGMVINTSMTLDERMEINLDAHRGHLPARS